MNKKLNFINILCKGNNNNNNNVVGYNMTARAPGANSDISPPALDFDDLPASQTVKWFAENPDLNPSKVFQQ